MHIMIVLQCQYTLDKTRPSLPDWHDCLPETISVALWPRTSRWARCNVRVTLEKVLAFNSLNSQSSALEICEACGYICQHVWRLLHAHGMDPYHLILLEALMLGDHAWQLNYCNFMLNTSEKNPSKTCLSEMHGGCGFNMMWFQHDVISTNACAYLTTQFSQQVIGYDVLVKWLLPDSIPWTFTSRVASRHNLYIWSYWVVCSSLICIIFAYCTVTPAMFK